MMRLGACLVFAAAAAINAQSVAQPGTQAQGRLFPPEDLGILESPDRDDWQQPERIMDELGIADGSHVADLGAGGGWFTVRLARRVGPNGLVYAEDIQKQMIDAIERRVRDLNLTNVKATLGTANDPRLPIGLQAVLIVDTYPQLDEPVNMLRRVGAALAPNGLIGIVDFKTDGAGGPGPPLRERIDPAEIRRDAERAGLKFRGERTFLRYQYLLIFGK